VTRKSKTAGGRTARGRTVSATEAQNNFGRVMDQAAADGVVFITRYDKRKVVVMSIEKYESLQTVASPDLDSLTKEFDTLIAQMQTPAAIAAANSLFAPGPWLTEAPSQASTEVARKQKKVANARRTA